MNLAISRVRDRKRFQYAEAKTSVKCVLCKEKLTFDFVEALQTSHSPLHRDEH
jgi:hypothetical protein